MRHLCPLAGLALSFAACSDDTAQLYRCEDTKPALDVAAVSVLEDSASIANMHDALVVDTSSTDAPMTASKKLTAVEVLVALPGSLFERFPDGAPLAIEVFDAATPTGTPVTVQQTLQRSTLTWEDTTIAAGQSTREQAHKTAWWRFELPDGGLPLTSETVVAGVVWPDQIAAATLYFGQPAGVPIGYSNYDRPCGENWSIYPDWRVVGTNIQAGTWVENSANAQAAGQGPNTCSWPMLKVELKTERLSASGCSN